MMKVAKRPLTIAVASLVALTAGAAVYLSFQERLEEARRLHQAKDILVASRIYAVSHSGHMPRDLADLATLKSESGGHRYYALPDGSRPFLDRAARELAIVTPGVSDRADAQTPFLCERHSDKRGRRVVGFVDASAVITDQSPTSLFKIQPAVLPASTVGDFITPLEVGRRLPH